MSKTDRLKLLLDEIQDYLRQDDQEKHKGMITRITAMSSLILGNIDDYQIKLF